MAGRIARWGVALVLGALWWWGVLRLVLVPDAGVLEGAVVAGGWGLSLLPVHCVPKPGMAGDGEGVGEGPERGRWRWRRGATTASRRRRSGGGSDPS
ncbi:hypothetical protein [Streptomyces sp. NBC_01176]|uniref:hypothetical protein n=1 Tax=Streptomyces sp. NBC_01176 TaxID=2903760 RepID=UPI003870BF4F|nr:hypothetical protein OG199_13255 [Streptomyces sp. NBC_01176]